jgi:hypothetical protein
MNLFNTFCKPFADYDNNTIASAYNKHETDLPLRSTGSHSISKLSTKSFIYKENIEGSKYNLVLLQYLFEMYPVI